MIRIAASDDYIGAFRSRAAGRFKAHARAPADYDHRLSLQFRFSRRGERLNGRGHAVLLIVQVVAGSEAGLAACAVARWSLTNAAATTAATPASAAMAIIAGWYPATSASRRLA